MTPGKTTGRGFGLSGLLATAIGLGLTAAAMAGENVSVEAQGITAEVQDVSAEVMAAGEGVYSQNCSYCHQAAGEGDGGSSPPLAANARLAEDDDVIRQVLQGSDYMPSFSFLLSDTEIAAVLTYVRNSWSNEFGPISEDQVAALR